jgi:tetratricopeptide (TPR) repeat protein
MNAYYLMLAWVAFMASTLPLLAAPIPKRVSWAESIPPAKTVSAEEATASKIQLGLGRLFYRQGRVDEALAALTKAIALNPKNQTAREWLLRVAALRLADYEE